MKLLINVFTLLILSFYSFSQVVVKTNLPQSIAPNSNLTIEIKINKGIVANFAKYQIDVPAGVTISEGESRTGNFSFEANRAKIVWVSIPTDPEFIISFKMNVGATSGNGVFNQRFFYLDNGTKKEDEMDPVTVTFSASGASTAISFNESFSANTVNTANTNSTTATPTKTTSTELTFEQKLEEHNKKHGGQTTEEKSKTPVNTSTTGLVFRIQLGALAADPGQAKYKAIGRVDVNKEDGFYKILYGSYNSKEDAMKGREDIKAKGFDGFVVRYQDGVRVK